jgi:hypothetical protein
MSAALFHTCFLLHVECIFHRCCRPVLQSDSFAIYQATTTDFYTFSPRMVERGHSPSHHVTMSTFTHPRMLGQRQLKLLFRRAGVLFLCNQSEGMLRCDFSPAIVQECCSKERSKVCWVFRIREHQRVLIRALILHQLSRTTQIG